MRFCLRLILRLHNVVYKLASAFAIKVEGGLHPKHRLMHYHQFFLDQIKSADRVLDIGCGNGALAYDLAGKAREVTAIDTNAKNEHAWKTRYGRENLHYLVQDATTYQPEHPYDVVVLSNVLEHIDRRIDFLKSVKHLAPLLLIRVPMINRDWITLYKKELGIEWRLDTTHCTEYTFETFRDELAQAGLSIESHSIQFGEIWAVTLV